MSWNASGTHLAVGTRNSRVYLLDVQSRQTSELECPKGAKGHVTCLAFQTEDPEGESRLAVGLSSGHLWLHRLNGKKLAKPVLSKHSSAVSYLGWERDILVSSAQDNSISFSDRDGRLLASQSLGRGCTACGRLFPVRLDGSPRLGVLAVVQTKTAAELRLVVLNSTHSSVSTSSFSLEDEGITVLDMLPRVGGEGGDLLILAVGEGGLGLYSLKISRRGFGSDLISHATYGSLHSSVSRDIVSVLGGVYPCSAPERDRGGMGMLVRLGGGGYALSDSRHLVTLSEGLDEEGDPVPHSQMLSMLKGGIARHLRQTTQLAVVSPSPTGNSQALGLTSGHVIITALNVTVVSAGCVPVEMEGRWTCGLSPSFGSVTLLRHEGVLMDAGRTLSIDVGDVSVRRLAVSGCHALIESDANKYFLSKTLEDDDFDGVSVSLGSVCKKVTLSKAVRHAPRLLMTDVPSDADPSGAEDQSRVPVIVGADDNQVVLDTVKHQCTVDTRGGKVGPVCVSGSVLGVATVTRDAVRVALHYMSVDHPKERHVSVRSLASVSLPHIAPAVPLSCALAPGAGCMAVLGADGKEIRCWFPGDGTVACLSLPSACAPGTSVFFDTVLDNTLYVTFADETMSVYGVHRSHVPTDGPVLLAASQVPCPAAPHAMGAAAGMVVAGVKGDLAVSPFRPLEATAELLSTGTLDSLLTVVEPAVVASEGVAVIRSDRPTYVRLGEGSRQERMVSQALKEALSRCDTKIGWRLAVRLGTVSAYLAHAAACLDVCDVEGALASYRELSLLTFGLPEAERMLSHKAPKVLPGIVQESFSAAARAVFVQRILVPESDSLAVRGLIAYLGRNTPEAAERNLMASRRVGLAVGCQMHAMDYETASELARDVAPASVVVDLHLGWATHLESTGDLTAALKLYREIESSTDIDLYGRQCAAGGVARCLIKAGRVKDGMQRTLPSYEGEADDRVYHYAEGDVLNPIQRSFLCYEAATQVEGQRHYESAAALHLAYSDLIQAVQAGPKAEMLSPDMEALLDPSKGRARACRCYLKARLVSSAERLLKSVSDPALLSDLAKVNEKAQPDRAIELYRRAGNTTACVSLLLKLDRVGEAVTLVRAAGEETEARAQAAQAGYAAGSDYTDSVSASIDRSSLPGRDAERERESEREEAQRVAERQTECSAAFEEARTRYRASALSLANHMASVGNSEAATEFYLAAGEVDQAFQAAQAQGTLAVFMRLFDPHLVGPAQLGQIADHFAQSTDPSQIQFAAHLLDEGGDPEGAVQLLLESDTEDGSHVEQALIVLENNPDSEAVARQVAEYVNASHSPAVQRLRPRLYLVLGDVAAAARTASDVALQLQADGNHKAAQQQLSHCVRAIRSLGFKVPADLLDELYVLVSYTLSKRLLRIQDHVCTAVCLSRVCQHVHRFGESAPQILLSAVVETYRAKMRQTSFCLGRTLLKQHRDSIDERYRRKVETIVRKHRSTDTDELPEAVPCSICDGTIPVTAASCPSCMSHIVLDASCGMPLSVEQYAECPHCQAPLGQRSSLALAGGGDSLVCPVCAGGVRLPGVCKPHDAFGRPSVPGTGVDLVLPLCVPETLDDASLRIREYLGINV
ncbi:hypothetical protein KIPB_004660 [Kipferlia bialata]|uniref:Uncharacterized protein n=1 Tax=Kipferlia bialata TaxID=797122 RepID=A0A9K3CUD5_9EUKA|nr:hypothetical protein KIPB_004660 [Kipferlia bialata]|eukprot:g4660.t1